MHIGIPFNSEIWYDLKKEEETLQKYSWLAIKTPKEAFKYIIVIRRLMYLHHISRRQKDKLTRRFFEAQTTRDSEGDWTKTDFENLKEIGCNSLNRFITVKHWKSVLIYQC